jgi:type IV secretion system protein VirB5
VKIAKIAIGIATATWINLASAQIPVTDIANITQNLTNHLETIAKWQQQYQQMTQQISQLKQEYSALTGSRGLGTILNDPAYRQYLPADWQAVYDAVQSGGYAGLTGRAKTLYEQNKIYDTCSQFADLQRRTACEAMAVKGDQDKAFALDAYDKAQARLDQINQLMDRINTTDDPKAIAELQGRIAAEEAMIQNEQTKLQMYQMVATAEDRIQRQRIRELDAKTWAATGAGVDVQPVQFGN